MQVIIRLYIFFIFWICIEKDIKRISARKYADGKSHQSPINLCFSASTCFQPQFDASGSRCCYNSLGALIEGPRGSRIERSQIPVFTLDESINSIEQRIETLFGGYCVSFTLAFDLKLSSFFFYFLSKLKNAIFFLDHFVLTLVKVRVKI